jgi:hypothetical protein
MLIRTRCEHCQTITELSKNTLGQVVICSRCGGQYVALAEAEPESDTGVIGLAMEEPDVQTGAAEVKTGGRVSRHSLKLPPPPPEDWNLTGDEDGETVPGQRFAPFRPRRKELEPFLDPEHAAGDNAVLLILGLIGFALLATVCFVLLIILCIVV